MTVNREFHYKQCIAVRGDLEMSAGKMAVQVAHASVGVILKDEPSYRVEESSKAIINWQEEGGRKIVLRVNTEQDIRDLELQCNENNIPCYVVTDFGLTELDPETVTCIGMGPCRNERMDRITGRLKLWK